MPTYHITGLSGSGKTYLGKELAKRGFKVIDTDSEPGLSTWVNKLTSQKAVDLPEYPYPKQWVDAHSWMWDADRLKDLISASGEKTVFFVGGARNERDFWNLFDGHFGLHVDTSILVRRLEKRDPKRWSDSYEIEKLKEENKYSKNHIIASDAILVDSSMPVEAVAGTILSHIG